MSCTDTLYRNLSPHHILYTDHRRVSTVCPQQTCHVLEAYEKKESRGGFQWAFNQQ